MLKREKLYSILALITPFVLEVEGKNKDWSIF